MAITPFTGSLGSKPLTQITPFTYRDGLTFLQILNEFEKWLVSSGVEINDVIVGNVDRWENLFSEFMVNVTDNIAEISDAAAAQLVKDSATKFSIALKQFVNSTTDPKISNLSQLFTTSLDTMGDQVDAATDQMITARAVAWTLETRFNANPPYLYFVYEAHTNGGPVPGVVGKHFANDYEKSWSEGELFKPPQISLESHVRQTGASLVANGSAWSTTGSNDGRMTGLQIKDGVFYQGFATSPKGRDAIGVDKRGKFHILRNGRDSIQKIMGMGITDTFTFGPPLTENGAREDLTGIKSEWAGFDSRRPRTIIGQKENGNVLVVQIVGDGPGRPGASPDECADLAMMLGLENSLLLDGGGSTQAIAGGNTVVRSSDADARPVPEVITFNVPYASAAGGASAWDSYPAINGATGDMKVRTTTSGERRLLMRGNIKGITAINTVVLVLPKQYWPNDWIYATVPCIFGGLAVMATCVIKSNGEVQITRKDGQEWLATDRYDFNIDEVLQ